MIEGAMISKDGNLRDRPTWAAVIRRNLSAWPRLSVVLVTVFVTSSFSLGETTESFDFGVGHWAGNVERSRNGQFNACTVSLHNAKDEMVLFRLDRSYTLSLGLFEKHWKGKAGSLIDIVAMVDHALIYAGAGMLFAEDTIFFEFADSAAALEQIQSGQMLSITSGNRNVAFKLDSVSQAVDFLKGCGKRKT